MRIRVLSDLHLEFASFDPGACDCDVVILAGDTHVGTKGVTWAKETFPDRPVIYVLGNHEYYRHAAPRLADKLRQLAEGSNVHVLDRGSVTIDGVRFLGCTLWAGLALKDRALTIASVAEALTDFKLIRVSPRYRRMVPEDMVKWHRAASVWLEKQLAEADNSGTVVVSHHAPSPKSLAPKTTTDWLDGAYASDLEPLIRSRQPRAWIHGHVHHASRYRIGVSEIICNPRGYPDESVAGFDDSLVIDV